MLKGLEELAIIMVINQARCQGGRLGNLRWGGGSGSASLINRVPAQQATLSDHTEGPGQSRVGSNGIYKERPAGRRHCAGEQSGQQCVGTRWRHVREVDETKRRVTTPVALDLAI